MRVLKQELYKTFMRSSVFGVLFFLLFFNFCLLGLPPGELEAKKENVNRAFQALSALPEEKRLPALEKRLEKMEGFYGGIKLYFGETFYEELVVLRGFRETLIQIRDYPEYREKIEQGGSLEAAIFQKKTEYGEKEEAATREAFRGLAVRKLPLINGAFLKSATEAPTVDVLNLVFIFYIVISLVVYEKKQGLFRLFSTMRNGRGSLISSKLLTTILTAAVSTLLFWGSAFLVSFFSYSGIGLSAPLQAVTGYDRSVLPLSVGGYLLLFLAVKIAVTTFIALFVLYVSLRMKRNTGIYLSILLLFFLSLVLRFGISGDSAFKAFHYVNLIPYLQVTPIFKVYFNLNVFETPVSMSVIFAITLPFFLILITVLTYLLFVRGGYRISLSRRRFFKIKERKFTCKLWRHEGYKLFVLQKAYVLLFVLASLQIFLAGKVQEPTGDDAYYKEYALPLSGEWTKEKEEIVRKEKKRFEELDRLQVNLQKKIKEKKISKQEADAAAKYITENRVSFPAFLRLMSRVGEVKRKPPGERIFVYEEGYQRIFGFGYTGVREEMIQTVLFLFCLMILFTSFITEESETGMFKLIRALPHGRTRFLCVKLSWGAVFAILMFLLSYLPGIIAVHKFYPMKELSAPLHAIPALEELLGRPRISIGGYLILIFGIRIVMALATLFISYLVAVKVRRNHVAVSILFLLLIFPQVLRLLGIDIIDYLSMTAFYSGNLLFDRLGQAAFIIGPFISLSILVGSALWLWESEG